MGEWSKRVTVYTLPDCINCELVSEALTAQGYEVVHFDLDMATRNSETVAEAAQAQGNIAPVVELPDGQFITPRQALSGDFTCQN